ncbi:MAG: DUF7575 domain-containing protein [Halococcoides sp.]
MTPDSGRFRAWIAVFLTLFFPGLGHLYVRAYYRAVPWIVLDIAVTAWIATTVSLPETLSVEALVEISQSVPMEAQIVSTSMTLVAALDVYLIVRMEQGTAGEDATRCPSCGKDIEEFEDLDFCPWCTDRLEPPEE